HEGQLVRTGNSRNQPAERSGLGTAIRRQCATADWSENRYSRIRTAEEEVQTVVALAPHPRSPKDVIRVCAWRERDIDGRTGTVAAVDPPSPAALQVQVEAPVTTGGVPDVRGDQGTDRRHGACGIGPEDRGSGQGRPSRYAACHQCAHRCAHQNSPHESSPPGNLLPTGSLGIHGPGVNRTSGLGHPFLSKKPAACGPGTGARRESVGQRRRARPWFAAPQWVAAGGRLSGRLGPVHATRTDGVAREKRLRRGGGRRFWPFQGEDDNEG